MSPKSYLYPGPLLQTSRSVLISCSCHNKLPPTGYSYNSGGQKYKIKVLAGLFPSGAPEGEHVSCLPPSFWWLPAPWHSLACRCITLIPASIFPCVLTSPSLSTFLCIQISIFLQHTSHWIKGSIHIPIHHDFISTQLHLPRPCFQIRSHSQFPGKHEFGGGKHYSTLYKTPLKISLRDASMHFELKMSNLSPNLPFLPPNLLLLQPSPSQ